MKFLGRWVIGGAVVAAALVLAVVVAAVYDEDERGRWYLG